MLSVKMKLTTHDVFRGKIKISQPEKGYRAGIDPLFLAASIPVKPGDSVLEVGAGVATALISVAQRERSAKYIGLEMQRELVKVASQNISQNSLQDCMEVMTGDLKTPPPRLAASSFSHVMANPPYFLEYDSSVSGNVIKANSNTEIETPLKEWVDFCTRMVKPKGSVSFVFSTSRLDDMLHHMTPKLGNIEIFPLWPKSGHPSKIFLARGWKNKKGPCRLLSGLVLHEESGKFTTEALSVLEGGLALDGWV